MSAELSYLFLSAGLLVAIHLIEVTHNIIGLGPVSALSGLTSLELPPWRERLAATEQNLAHNLVIFAVLVLGTTSLDVTNETTALGAAIVFFARLAHAFVYTARVPFLRAVTYVVSLVGFALVASPLLQG